MDSDLEDHSTLVTDLQEEILEKESSRTQNLKTLRHKLIQNIRLG